MKAIRISSFLLSSFLLIILLHTNSIAQETETHKGLYAFQFQISSNFTLSSFQGTVLSGKYNFTENDAVRLGLSINQNNQSRNSLIIYNNPLTTSSNIIDNAKNTYEIILQYLRNNYLRNNFNFYYGGGPSFQYSHNRNKNYMAGQNYTEYTDRFRSFGITALAGIEWYFNESMSLSAQYGLTYYYYEDVYNSDNGTNIIEIIQQSSTKNKTSGFQINPNSVLFGLTIYF